MRFPTPLIRGRLIRRYKRFLSDIVLDSGEEVVAHCANPGAMTGLLAPNAEVWLSRASNPSRKLKYSWELVRVDDGLVGINTNLPNAIVAEAIAAGRVPELAGYGSMRREVKYGVNSRIDLLLEDPARPTCHVEVKNVHLRRAEDAEFPDCVTLRGAKHLRELASVVQGGGRAVLFYLVQRADCDRMTVAADIDPGYAAAFRDARDHGVEALCYACRLSTEAIKLDRPLVVVD
ncbi:MAG: DNA/RNA nuclease SfsA [Rhodospirillaceae bacterium]|nr:DNA/RNA nuclease SfsA [Rhodospirillaceae bacterium]